MALKDGGFAWTPSWGWLLLRMLIDFRLVVSVVFYLLSPLPCLSLCSAFYHEITGRKSSPDSHPPKSPAFRAMSRFSSACE